MHQNQVMTASPTFASALSEAIERRGLSLTQVRDELAARGHPISLAALSYWRSGLRVPERLSSLESIPTLEATLDLEPGSLSRFLISAEARRIGPLQAFETLLDYPVQDPRSTGIFVAERDVSRITAFLTIIVGADRRIASTNVRRLVVANRDGVDGMTTFLSTSVPDEDGTYRFRAVAGCRIGEVRQAADNVHEVRLLFPRPLLRGESILTEVEVTGEDTGPEPIDDYELAAEHRLEELLIWLRFDERETPAKCWLYFHEGDLKHEWPIDVEGLDSVHYRLRDFGPGGLGIRWEW